MKALLLVLCIFFSVAGLSQDLDQELKLFGLNAPQLKKVKTAIGNRDPKKIKEVRDWLFGIGVPKKDLRWVVSGFPNILTYGIKTKLQPFVEWLVDIGLSHEEIIRVLIDFPSLTAYSLDENLKSKVEWLKKQGVDAEHIPKIIRTFPQLMGLSEETLDTKIAWLRRYQVSDEGIARILRSYPAFFSLNLKTSIEEKRKWYIAKGATAKNFTFLVSSFPQIFGLSVRDNLEPKWIYFLKTLKLTKEDIFRDPTFLAASLTRIDDVVQWMKANNLKVSQLERSVKLRLIKTVNLSNVLENVKTLEGELELWVEKPHKKNSAKRKLLSALQDAGKVEVIIRKYANDEIPPKRLKGCEEILAAIAG